MRDRADPIRMGELPQNYQQNFNVLAQAWRGTIISTSMPYQFMENYPYSFEGFKLYITNQISYIPTGGVGDTRFSILPISLLVHDRPLLSWVRPYYGARGVRA